jgi:Tfp pilus assembly protein PilF
MYKVPNELKRAIIQDRVVVLVGAGLSYNLYNKMGMQLKDWKNYVNQLLLYLKKQGYLVDHLIPLTEYFEPIKVLDLIECTKSITNNAINVFTKEFFELDDDVNDYNLHKNICSLFSKIITTNYDTAFENAIPSLRKSTAFEGKDYELTRCNDVNAQLLFKLHGCYENRDSMVLLPSNYQKFYDFNPRNTRHSLFAFRNIIYSHTLLIIGSGMGDFQINSIFNEISELQGAYAQEYFIITKEQPDKRLDFLTPILINDYTEIDSIINELRIIKEENLTEDQQETNRLKIELANTLSRKDELQHNVDSSNTKTEKMKNLLEREAFDHFSRALEFSIAEEHQNAIIEYRTCCELKPDMHEALNNWGIALSNQARSRTGKEADDLFGQAYVKYEKALEIKPDKHEAIHSWGIALYDQAKTKTGKEADELFEQACAKYEKTLEIKPDKHEALNNWGVALANQARLRTGEEADELFKQAYEKYKKALDIKPDYHEALNNWGSALTHHARQKTGKAKVSLQKKAFAILSKAVALGGGCYNFACINALRGDKATAYYHLDKVLANKEETVEFVEKDDDWILLRDDKEFKEILDKYR